jgi:peptidylprolyl isomerase
MPARFTLFIFLCLYSQLTWAQQDTVYTPSGLKYLVVKTGSGPSPIEGDRVKVRYVGKFLSGEIFEALEDGDVFMFKIGDPTIIKGWSEGFKLMHAGEKGIFVVPPFLAYGTKGVKDPEGIKEYMIPPNSTLVYEVELISIK